MTRGRDSSTVSRLGTSTVLLLVAGLAAPGSATADERAASVAGSVRSVWSGAVSPAPGANCSYTNISSASNEQALTAEGGWRTSRSDAIGEMGLIRVGGDAVSEARVTSDARGQVRAEIRVTASSWGVPSPGQPCDNTFDFGGRLTSNLTVTSPSWLVVNHRAVATAGAAKGHVWISGAQAGFPTYVSAGGSTTRLASPGSYDVEADVLSSAHVPLWSGAEATGAMRGSASITFVPIGTRRTHTGNGTGFISFGHRDCARNLVRASFSSAARSRLRSATFYVNGRRTLVLRGSQLQRSSVALRSIARTSAGKVGISMVTKAGARRTTASTSWPCA